MRSGVRQAFAQTFRGRPRESVVPGRGCLCPRQFQRALPGPSTGGRRAQPALLEIQGRQPPHVAAIAGHRDRDSTMAIAASRFPARATDSASSDRKYGRRACARLASSRPSADRMMADAVGRTGLAVRPTDEHLRPIIVVGEPVPFAELGGGAGATRTRWSTSRRN